MGFRLKSKGNFKKTKKFLNTAANLSIEDVLRKYAEDGVQALSGATPRETGKTADSWGYEIRVSKESAAIYWTNSNINDGVNIAVILQYGHGTGNGGYVQGKDYINPAIRPIFDEIVYNLWNEVTRA